VSMDFTPTGADRFEDITGRNVKRRFAIILDEKVESAPVIQTKIGGGRAQITMGSQNPDQQLQDARKLELVLRSGALPAPISPSNEQRIGPSLGKDAIQQSMKGAIASGVLVVVFMVVIYSRAGLIADVAVVFNLILQIAVLAMFGASMTLPGIAGLVLTMGIAVDANVLINERIREELRNGKSPRAAVDIGYDKAFSAILDGHVTTLLSGLILAQYGTGPIKGFAITLIVGIAISLFTGVVCTRLMFDWAVRGRKIKTLSLG
jgi:preprotein translocase subunit SecD